MNKAKAFILSFFSALLLLLCLGLPTYAQEPVPTETEELEEPDEEEEDLVPVPITEIDSLGTLPVEVADTTVVPIPGKAAFFSAVLPGLGQAYNNAHWKIPIIYIGAAFIVDQVRFFNREYSLGVRNINLIQYDPNVTEIDGRSLDQWNNRSITAIRQRDYLIIIGGVLYMLNIVEAYVDAHLQDFNVNDDLAIQFKPALMNAGPGGTPGAGIALTLTIK